MNMGFAMPMPVGTIGSLMIVIIAVCLCPETTGKHLVAELEVIKAAESP
jgi:hypothetical protein